MRGGIRVEGCAVSRCFCFSRPYKVFNTRTEDLFLKDVVDNKSKVFLRIPPGRFDQGCQSFVLLHLPGRNVGY